MNIPEEFGKYLLLKKLTEDPLGETFRAGKVGQGAAWSRWSCSASSTARASTARSSGPKVSGRGAVQQALQSPNIGSGVDLGTVRSFPYAAYDYISGKSLAALLAAVGPAALPHPHRPCPADRRAPLPRPRGGLRDAGCRTSGCCTASWCRTW